MVSHLTPPPGKNCKSDSAGWTTCIEGTCEQWSQQCELKTTLCQGKNSCSLSKNTYPYATIDSCKIDATLSYKKSWNTGMITIQQPVIVNKLRGATCDLGCAPQIGCFGTFKDNDGISWSCSVVSQADCGIGIHYSCTKNPIICSRPDAGYCANDGGPCTDPTLYASDGGVCAYGESCSSTDCTAAGYNVVCAPAGGCDNDNDGYNGTYLGCTNALDCNDDPADGGASIHPPGTYETGIALCSNGRDDDCDGTYDYEGALRDGSCAVSVISADATPPACNALSLTATCEYSVPGALITSQRAYVTRGGAMLAPCEWQSWSGAVATFYCPLAGLSAGAYNVTCSVDTAIGTLAGAAKDDAFIVTPCNVAWEGYLIDRVTQQPIATVVNAYVSVDGVTTALSAASFSIPGIVPGNRAVMADAEGYDPGSDMVSFIDDPTKHNITLSPAVCQPDCSFDGYCDYSCLDEGACAMYGGLSASEIAQIKAICQEKKSGYILYNGSIYVRCCASSYEEDPRILPEDIAVAFSLQSTSRAIVPHTRLVTLYGKLHSLVVISFSLDDAKR